MAGAARPEIRRVSGPQAGGEKSERDGVEANSRLTSSVAAALFVLLAAEGVTVLSVRSLLTAHVFIGVLLLPPVLLKMGSTMYRFARYYQGDPAYRQKGPPPWLLRVLGPAVVVLTLAVLGTGVGLMYVGTSGHRLLLGAHKATFILWFLVMTVHVLGHLSDTARLGPLDWVGRARRVSGAGLRRGALLASLAAGVAVGVLLLSRVTPYLAHFGFHSGG